MVDILILGATGVSGRQTTRYLASHPEHSKFSFAIAGRSEAKLKSLASDLSLPSSVKIFVVDVTNFDQLEETVKQSKVVLNTVGPYYRWGTPVVRACARNGVHYADLTGEKVWIKQIINEYDYCASKTGSIIVPSCGVDSVPSDISVFLANKALKAVSPDIERPLQIEHSTTAWELHGIMSHGTFSTITASFEEVPVFKMKEARRNHYLSPVSGRPTPLPRLLYRLTLPTTLQTIVGGIWFMKPSNTAIVQRSQGLLEYEAQSTSSLSGADETELQKARYGSLLVYEEFWQQSSAFAGVMLSLSLAVTFTLMAFKPFRWFFKQIGPKETTHYSDQRLEQGSFTTTNVSVSASSPTSPAPVKVQTTLHGKGDPGYFLSPLMLAESGLALLHPEKLGLLSKRGGVLTPATALGDVLVERLQACDKFDLRWEVVGGKGESRKTV